MYKIIDLIRLTEYCKAHDSDTILVGIREDFGSTADYVWINGMIIRDACPHVSSFWGTPTIYNETTDEYVDCWKESDVSVNWDNTVVQLLTFRKSTNVPF